MELGRWDAFVNFLSRSGILINRANEPIARESIDTAALFTNAYLPD